MAYISSIGTYIPLGRVDNIKRGQSLGLESDFITEQIGFKKLSTRHDDESVLDMAEKAVLNLFQKTPKLRNQADFLIFLGQMSERPIPHLSAQLHERLNLASKTICLDIGHSCAGYVHALEVVKSLLSNDKYHHVILVSADSYKSIIDPKDKTTAVIFGDAATATHICSEGPGLKIMNIILGSVEKTTKALTFKRDSHLIHDPKLAFDLILNTVPDKIKEISKEIGPVDRYLFHQGTKYIVKVLTKTCDISPEKVPFNASEFGNTISSSLPLLLADEISHNTKGNLLLCGFGGGLSWGVCHLKG